MDERGNEWDNSLATQPPPRTRSTGFEVLCGKMLWDFHPFSNGGEVSDDGAC